MVSTEISEHKLRLVWQQWTRLWVLKADRFAISQTAQLQALSLCPKFTDPTAKEDQNYTWKTLSWIPSYFGCLASTTRKPIKNPLKISIFLRDSLCYYPPVYRCVEHCRPLVFFKFLFIFPKLALTGKPNFCFSITKKFQLLQLMLNCKTLICVSNKLLTLLCFASAASDNRQMLIHGFLQFLISCRSFSRGS